MNRYYLLFLIITIMLFSCSPKTDKQTTGDNPFFSDYNTPFNIPPFEKIKSEHYLPAYKEGITRHDKEIEAIINNSEAPNFKNTIEAFEYSGGLLNKVKDVFSNITSSLTDDTIRNIAKEVSPLVTQHSDNISMNEKLFERIKKVYDAKETLNLTKEQMMLLEKTYKRFVRGGAALNAEQKAKLREINKELSLLGLKFGDNVLAENNSFKLVIDKQEDLAGLPQGVIASAAADAKDAKMEGKWIFTLQNPSVMPFLQYSDKRELREKIWKAYANRGNNNDKNDNKANIVKIANLKLEKAKLLGYKNYSEYVLAENMAKTPEAVYNLLKKLWEPALKSGKKEAAELQALMDKEGKKQKLEPWDWRYYAEKQKKAKFDIDEEEIRPYFLLENVKNGVLYTASKLFGLKFIERNDVPKYHKDAVAYEVKNADDSFVGIVYMDFHPRASKRGGAWMNNFRDQEIIDGKDVRPIITLNFNFTKPSGDQPALLTFDEVSTTYHEFGHALHGLLSKCTYSSLSGTSVSRDFVELPSQVLENWASEPEVLKEYAKHYKTGEVIPKTLLDKMKSSNTYGQGFSTVEYLSASMLDMDYHNITEPLTDDVLKFEAKSMAALNLIPEIVPRYRSTYYNHIFSGGYSSGYYSYIWAEILDADAFEAFREHGIFDQKTALAFRQNILEKGGTDDAMELYKRFRGKDPEIAPLLKRRGLQ